MRGGLSLRKAALTVLWDALSLFLGLYGILLCLVTAFALPVEPSALGLECLAYAAALTGLSRVSGRGAGRLLWLLPLAGCGVLVWQRYEWIRAGLFLFARQITGSVSRSLRMGSALDITPWVGRLTAGQEAEAAGLAMAAVLLVYGLWLGWLQLRVRSFWVSFLATFPLLGIPLAVTLTPGEGALTLVLLFWGGGLLTRLFARQEPYGAAKLGLCALLPGLLLLWGLSALFPSEGYVRPTALTAARQALMDWAAEVGKTVADRFSDGPGWMGTAERVELKNAGPLHYTGRTDLRVESETTGHIYLRGASQAVYTGESWEMLPEEAYRDLGTGLVSVSSYYEPDKSRYLDDRLYWLEELQPINFPALLREGEGETRFTVEQRTAAEVVFIPYDLATTPQEMDKAAFVGDAYLAREKGVGRYILYAKQGLSPDDPLVPLEAEILSAELSYADKAEDYYTQLPASVREELEPFVAECGDDWRGGIDAAQGVARYLEERAVYDLNTPKTPEGEDFALYFLKESRRGYCMHFATAATLLLRAMGIPARYVSGYVADTRGGEWVEVPDSNAHAWVEVYCTGYGWYPVEVTPGFPAVGTVASSPAASHGPLPTPSAEPTPTPAPSASQSPAAPTPEQGTPSAGGEEAFRLPWWGWAVLGLILAALILIARRELAGEKRRRAFSQKDPNRAVIELYGYRAALLAYGGEKEEDEEVERLAKKARFSQHILTEEERAYVEESTRTLSARIAREAGWRGRLRLRFLAALY